MGGGVGSVHCLAKDKDGWIASGSGIPGKEKGCEMDTPPSGGNIFFVPNLLHAVSTAFQEWIITHHVRVHVKVDVIVGLQTDQHLDEHIHHIAQFTHFGPQILYGSQNFLIIGRSPFILTFQTPAQLLTLMDRYYNKMQFKLDQICISTFWYEDNIFYEYSRGIGETLSNKSYNTL
jgi:hypothetical protein